MRGHENPQASMISYVSLEQRVPKDHPLRTLCALVDGILAKMSALFDRRYSHTGRPSISLEQLRRARLVQILFTIRSVRKPCAAIGADKGYDTPEFGAALERRGIKAHVARKVSGSAFDRRTARGKGYAMSLRRRKLIEETLGWIKRVGGCARRGAWGWRSCRGRHCLRSRRTT